MARGESKAAAERGEESEEREREIEKRKEKEEQKLQKGDLLSVRKGQTRTRGLPYQEEKSQVQVAS